MKEQTSSLFSMVRLAGNANNNNSEQTVEKNAVKIKFKDELLAKAIKRKMAEFYSVASLLWKTIRLKDLSFYNFQQVFVVVVDLDF